jgi:hypothetical protein
MEEKRAVLKNDRASTYLAHTHAEEGGRFAKPVNVIGETPVPQYPAGPNWAHDPSGVEPVLDYSIDALEPVGTAQEIQKSLGDEGGTSWKVPPDDAERASVATSAPSPGVAEDALASLLANASSSQSTKGRP